jgi:hypothetical protein
MVQDELKTWPPAVAEKIFAGLHQKVSRGWPIIGRNGGNQVPGNRKFEVAGVKIYDIIGVCPEYMFM